MKIKSLVGAIVLALASSPLWAGVIIPYYSILTVDQSGEYAWERVEETADRTDYYTGFEVPILATDYFITAFPRQHEDLLYDQDYSPDWDFELLTFQSASISDDNLEDDLFDLVQVIFTNGSSLFLIDFPKDAWDTIAEDFDYGTQILHFENRYDGSPSAEFHLFETDPKSTYIVVGQDEDQKYRALVGRPGPNTVVPEPSTLGLLLLGLGLLNLPRRKRA